MDKYGFDKDYAEFLERWILIHELHLFHGKHILKHDNEKNIEIIKKSRPPGPNPDLDNVRTIDLSNQCSLIEFTIKNEKYSIDDPSVISTIQALIKSTSFVFNKKMKRGKQHNPTILKELAIELIEKAPTGTEYSKRVWVGSIFSEFLPEYNTMEKNFELAKKIADLIR